MQSRRLLCQRRPHAEDLGCGQELEAVVDLLENPGGLRQLALARGADRLPGLVGALAEAY